MPPVFSIILAQLFGTSLWFAANGAAGDLMRAWHLTAADIGLLTNAVQLGFIIGTLTFSLSGLADRFSASRIFAVCAVSGAILNAMFAFGAHGLQAGLPLRFAIGICLAGIYPLSMKLIVSWVPDRAGNALSQLIGMQTIGVALPYGVRAVGASWPWQPSMLVSSGLALIAAAMIWRLGDGPHLVRTAGARSLDIRRLLSIFAIPNFRAAALGYFGHMWELYAFWTLIPTFIVVSGIASQSTAALSGWSFAVTAAGAIGCMVGGLWSKRIGSARVAAVALGMSALCCALFPLSGAWGTSAKILLLLAWGISVVADSPHFSALSAKACPPEMVGSALAFQNAIGFAITMVSIQIGVGVVENWGSTVAWLLLPGPLLGLMGLRRLIRAGA